MASYFGEVIHPSSRAFWNDGDDDDILDNSQENLEFLFNWLVQEPTVIEKLFIIEGEALIDFIMSSLLENTKCVCTINCEFNKYCTKVYAIENVYLCTISKNLNLAHAGALTTAIIPLLNKSKHLYLLSAQHMSHFKGEEDINSASFLKSLHSQKAKNDVNMEISTLNQPNIVTGLCAGVLSYAEIANLHCIMYILYTDTLTLDSKNSLPLIKLLSKLFEKTITTFTIKDKCFNKGNLYM